MNTIHHFYPWGDVYNGYSGSSFVLRSIFNNQLLKGHDIIVYSPAESRRFSNQKISSIQIKDFPNVENSSNNLKLLDKELDSYENLTLLSLLLELRNNDFVINKIKEIEQMNDEVYFHYPFWLKNKTVSQNSLVVYDIIGKTFSNDSLIQEIFLRYEKTSLGYYGRKLFCSGKDLVDCSFDDSSSIELTSHKLNQNTTIVNFLKSKLQIEKNKTNIIFVGSNYFNNVKTLDNFFDQYPSIQRSLGQEIVVYLSGSINDSFNSFPINHVRKITLNTFEINFISSLFDFIITPQSLKTGLSIKKLLANTVGLPQVVVTESDFTIEKLGGGAISSNLLSVSQFIEASPFMNEVRETLMDFNFIETLSDSDFEMREVVIDFLLDCTPIAEVLSASEIKSLSLGPEFCKSINSTLLNKIKTVSTRDFKSTKLRIINLYKYFYKSCPGSFLNFSNEESFFKLCIIVKDLYELQVLSFLSANKHDSSTIHALRVCLKSFRRNMKHNLFNYGVLNITNGNYFGYNYLLFLKFLIPFSKTAKDIHEILRGSNFSYKLWVKNNSIYLVRLLSRLKK